MHEDMFLDDEMETRLSGGNGFNDYEECEELSFDVDDLHQDEEVAE